ncbi:hypothetical protein Misp03_31360 [Microbispora sp. NBRC 16548]|nr:hypothetical protein Misp03_31360 [Microbispora sp. NBRC 16548]
MAVKLGSGGDHGPSRAPQKPWWGIPYLTPQCVFGTLDPVTARSRPGNVN